MFTLVFMVDELFEAILLSAILLSAILFVLLVVAVEPEFVDIFPLPVFVPVFVLVVVVVVLLLLEPLFVFVPVVEEFVALAGLLVVFALLLAVSQAIPIAPRAKTVDNTKVFFILIKFSCLLQRLFIPNLTAKPRSCSKRFNFQNIRQYKFLFCDSQLKKS